MDRNGYEATFANTTRFQTPAHLVYTMFADSIQRLDAGSKIRAKAVDTPGMKARR